MNTNDNAWVRRMIDGGLTDADIAEADAGSPQAASEHEAMYGPPDDEDFGGPIHLQDDGYYVRNGAGEYAWM